MNSYRSGHTMPESIKIPKMETAESKGSLLIQEHRNIAMSDDESNIDDDEEQNIENANFIIQAP